MLNIYTVMKTYDSILLAKFLLSLAREKYYSLNMTKLQKLMYIVYGYYLANFNHKIVSESAQAWPYGPVFPAVHKRVDYTKIIPLSDPVFSEIRHDIELVRVLDRVVETYANITASQLSNWSHKDGSPWKKTTERSNFRWSNEIPDELIKGYFSTLSVV